MQLPIPTVLDSSELVVSSRRAIAPLNYSHPNLKNKSADRVQNPLIYRFVLLRLGDASSSEGNGSYTKVNDF